jgi:outer membrane protein
VRVGALGTFTQSSSNLYEQTIASVNLPGVGLEPTGVGPQVQIPSRGATYSNFYSADFQGGYSLTQNWSVEVATGFPVWSTVKVNGYSPDGPPSGTVLVKVMPAGVPITGVYRFTQFGKFQPYLGAGVAPTFAWAVQDGYATGTSYQSALALIVQGGFDYMFDKHWGLFFDVKQGFVGTTASSTGVNNTGLPPGIIMATGTIKTNARPVTFATGISYRF